MTDPKYSWPQKVGAVDHKAHGDRDREVEGLGPAQTTQQELVSKGKACWPHSRAEEWKGYRNQSLPLVVM